MLVMVYNTIRQPRSQKQIVSSFEPRRMSTHDFDVPEFPRRIAEKLKLIREHIHMTPDEFAPLVRRNSGAEIEAYERDLGSAIEGGLLVATLWHYVRLARVAMDDLIDDQRELVFPDKCVITPRTGLPVDEAG